MNKPLHDLEKNELEDIKKSIIKVQRDDRGMQIIVLLMAVVVYFVIGPIPGCLILVIGTIGVYFNGSNLPNKIRKNHQVQNGNLIDVIKDVFEARDAEKANDYDKAIKYSKEGIKCYPLFWKNWVVIILSYFRKIV